MPKRLRYAFFLAAAPPEQGRRALTAGESTDSIWLSRARGTGGRGEWWRFKCRSDTRTLIGSAAHAKASECEVRARREAGG